MPLPASRTDFKGLTKRMLHLTVYESNVTEPPPYRGSPTVTIERDQFGLADQGRS